MAFPTVIDTTNTPNLGAVAATENINLSGSIVAGRLLLVFLYSSKAFTTTAGWTVLGSFVQATVTSTVAALAKTAAGSDALTLTFVGGNGNANAISTQVDNWSGSISDVKWVGTDATADPPSLTMGGNVDNLWLPFVTSASGLPTGAPTNYTGFVSNSVGVVSAQRSLTALTEDPGAFSGGSTFFPSAHTVGVAPAAAGVAPYRHIVTQAAIQRASTW